MLFSVVTDCVGLLVLFFSHSSVFAGAGSEIDAGSGSATGAGSSALTGSEDSSEGWAVDAGFSSGWGCSSTTALAGSTEAGNSEVN